MSKIIDSLYKRLDLNDNKGEPDHGKVMGFLYYLMFMGFKAFGVLLTPFELVVSAAVMYGPRMFIAFLKHKAEYVELVKGRSEPPASGV